VIFEKLIEGLLKCERFAGELIHVSAEELVDVGFRAPGVAVKDSLAEKIEVLLAVGMFDWHVRAVQIQIPLLSGRPHSFDPFSDRIARRLFQTAGQEVHDVVHLRVLDPFYEHTDDIGVVEIR